jgi:hypothetical protein
VTKRVFTVGLVLVVTFFGAPLVAVPASADGNPTIVVTTTADVVDANDGVLSLREAVTKANTDPGADTIQLVASATYELTTCADDDTNVSGDLDATDVAGLTIAGSASVIEQTCSEQSAQRVLDSASGPLTVLSTTVQGGRAFVGAAVRATGALDFEDGSIRASGRPTSPGPFQSALLVGTLTMRRSIVEDNPATAIYQGSPFPPVAPASLIEDSVIRRNGRLGNTVGGIDSYAPLAIRHSELLENRVDGPTATNQWGAVGGVRTVSDLQVIDSSVVGNVGFVGGIRNDHQANGVQIRASRIEQNRGVIGGGLSASVDMVDTVVQYNTAALGAGMYGSGTITSSSILANEATDTPGTTAFGGGGIMFDQTLTIERSTVTQNHAPTGAAVLAAPGGATGSSHLVLRQSSLVGNQIDLGRDPFVPDRSTIAMEDTTGGPLPQGGTLTATQSAVDRSVLGSGCGLRGVAVSSGGYSFWPDSSCGAPVTWGDVIGGDPSVVLDSNTGTPTLVPLLGSVLKDRIPPSDPACSGVDQREVTRPQGMGCDIGAGESPEVPAGFSTGVPARIADSRYGPWFIGQTPGGKLHGGQVVELKVAGTGDLPQFASGVVLNITSTEATSEAAYVTVWPSGQLPPPTSNLNLQPGANVANLVTVVPGADGKVSIYTNVGETHLVVDFLGYYAPSEHTGFTSMAPARVLDTRTGPVPEGWPVGQRVSIDPMAIHVPVAGVHGVPADAMSVVVNITSTQADSDLTFVQAYPTGGSPGGMSNLNAQPQYNVSNQAIVQVGVGGAIDLSVSSGSTHLVVDVMGYFRSSAGDRFLPMNPARLLDTRSGLPMVGGESRTAQLAGLARIPSNATSVLLNVTATQASSNGGFATLWPHGTTIPSPLTSNLNYRPPFNTPNGVTAKVGTAGSVELYNGFGTAHLVVDATGYFVSAS